MLAIDIKVNIASTRKIRSQLPGTGATVNEISSMLKILQTRRRLTLNCSQQDVGDATICKINESLELQRTK